MKKRDVILDFTTLLDIALILLFFFILFSNLQVTDASDAADKKMQEAESLYSQAENMHEQLENELEHIKEAPDRDGENIDGILEFDKGLNVKFILEVQSENVWELNVYKGQESIGDIRSDSNVAVEVIKLLEHSGYEPGDTLICDYIYNASQPGTLAAYRAMTEVIKSVKQEFKYFYYSETDISMMED
ncbi:MAG: hypothetical protein IJB96_02670 [Lachnospira sp.]|nr:hypothetical protein [Lachnospira sp.]